MGLRIDADINPSNIPPLDQNNPEGINISTPKISEPIAPPKEISNWNDAETVLRNKGYEDDDINKAKILTQQHFSDLGYSSEDIDKVMSIPKKYDFTKIQKEATENLKRNPDKLTNNFMDMMEIGTQQTALGMLVKNKTAPEVHPDHMGFANQIAIALGQMRGDLPLYAAGGAMGAIVATTGVVAAPIMASALVAGGAFAVAQGLRSWVADYYRSGENRSYEEYWAGMSAALIESSKGMMTGMSQSLAGTEVGIAAVEKGLPPVVAKMADVATQIAMMTTVGKALEGEIPKFEDFTVAAAVIAGLHLIGVGIGKVHEIQINQDFNAVKKKLLMTWEQKGIKPGDVVIDATKDQTVRQDLLSSNVDIPQKYQDLPGSSSKEGSKEVKPQPESLLSEAEQTIESLIARDAPRENWKFGSDEFYTNYVDRLHPINMYVALLRKKIEINANKNPYIAARLTSGDWGRGDHIIKYGTYDVLTKLDNGEGFEQILKPFADRYNSVSRYMVAKRIIELDQILIKGKDGELTNIKAFGPENHEKILADAKQLVKEQAAEFEEVSGKLVKFQNRVLKMLLDSGILDPKEYQQLVKTHGAVIPFYRLMEEEVNRGAGGALKVYNPLDRIMGDGRLVLDPFTSIVKNVYFFTKLAERNLAIGKLVELAKQLPEESKGFLTKSSAHDTVKTSVTKEEIANSLGKIFGTVIPPEILDKLDVFRKKSKILDENEFAYYAKGTREVWDAHPLLAQAINGLGPESASLILKVFSFPAKMLRVGTTVALDFTGANIPRDQLGKIFTPEGREGLPFVSFVEGAASILKEDKSFRDWLKNGGAAAAMADINRDYVTTKILKPTSSADPNRAYKSGVAIETSIKNVKDIFDLNKDIAFIEQGWNFVNTELAKLAVISELSENATRVGVFREHIKSGKTPLEAAYASREATIDFARRGAKMKAVSMIIAFFNPGIQGLDKFGRNFKDDPKATLFLGAVMTTATALLWWSQKDDPRIDGLPYWEKAAYWHVATKDHIYRFPAPREYSLFFNAVPKRILEAFVQDNPNAFKDFGSDIRNTFVPNLLPTAVVPLIEMWANKSVFTNRPLIPAGKEHLFSELQYGPYASELGKELSALIGSVPMNPFRKSIPPAYIDAIINDWTGTMGRQFMAALNELIRSSKIAPGPVKPAKTLKDIPGVGAFLSRYPTMADQRIQDFHDRYEQNEVVFKSIDERIEAGDAVAARKYMQLTPLTARVKEINKGLSMVNKSIQFVDAISLFDAKRKRELIDKLTYSAIIMATEGNRVMDIAEKAFEASKEKK